MGKLKKDISSSVYLQFVNKIWKNTSTCCTCTIRNGECVRIAQKGKCKAFRNELNSPDILVFKDDEHEIVTTRYAVSRALEANRENEDNPWETVDAVLEYYAMDPETSLSILYNLLASADIMAESFYVK